MSRPRITTLPDILKDLRRRLLRVERRLQRLASGDTGWVTLAGHLSSGYTGTLEGKLSAGNIEIRGTITGDFQVGNTYISSPLPAPFDAPPVQPRGPGYIGGGGIAVATNESGGLVITATKTDTYCGFNIRYSP